MCAPWLYLNDWHREGASLQSQLYSLSCWLSLWHREDMISCHLPHVTILFHGFLQGTPSGFKRPFRTWRSERKALHFPSLGCFAFVVCAISLYHKASRPSTASWLWAQRAIISPRLFESPWVLEFSLRLNFWIWLLWGFMKWCVIRLCLTFGMCPLWLPFFLWSIWL